MTEVSDRQHDSLHNLDDGLGNIQDQIQKKTMSTRIGECRLCGGYGELVEGHIWPAYSYKRFVSESEKGGRFADMIKVNWSNSQYQKYWFCHKCDNELLSGMEKYAAEFSTQFKEGAADPYVYTEMLLPFVTSISWRVALFHIERENIELTADGKAALHKWKDYLVAKGSGIAPHSQHAFVIFDQEQGRGLHRGIGGEVYPTEGLVLSHVGPLLMVGWLDRRYLSAEEEAIWARSEVFPTGGTIAQIATQEVFDLMITPSFLKLLAGREDRLEELIVELAKKKGLLLPGDA